MGTGGARITILGWAEEITYDQVSDAIQFRLKDGVCVDGALVGIPSHQRAKLAQTFGMVDDAGYGKIPLARADWSDVRTAGKVLGAPFVPKDEHGSAVAAMRYAIRLTADGTPPPQEAPKVPQVPQDRNREARRADAKAGVSTVDDGLRAAREALGLGDDHLSAIIEEIAAARVEEALKHLKPVTYKVGERKEVRIKGIPHHELTDTLKLVQCGVLPFLVGPAGTGKSTLAKQVAEALGLSFATIVCHPTMTMTDVKGYRDGHGRYDPTPLRTALEFGGVVLVDEVDGCHPGVAKGINEISAASPGDMVSFPDGMVEVHKDFVMIAAANTFGRGADRVYVAGVQLDASTLDRFHDREVGYDEELEMALAGGIAGPKGETWCAKVHRIRRNLDAHGASLQVIVSTRMVLDGAKVIAGGFPEREAFNGKIGRRHPDTTIAKLTEGVTIDG